MLLMHIESGKLFYPPGFGFIITSSEHGVTLVGCWCGGGGEIVVQQSALCVRTYAFKRKYLRLLAHPACRLAPLLLLAFSMG